MKFSDVDFLDVDDVENLHAQALAVSGGAAGLRDRGLLESAVAVPLTVLYGTVAYPSIAQMAAALAYALAKNHAFVDGNKRAAAGATVAFLRLNGSDVTFAGQRWEDAFVNLAADVLTRDRLAALIADEMGGDVPVEL